MNNNKARRITRQGLCILILVLLLITLLVLDLNAGYVPLSFEDMGALLNGTASPALELSIVTFRLPRIIMALLVGVGLSVSGCVLQGVTRNELADPGVLGINAGAGLMVALFISVFSARLENATLGIPLAAFVGAGLVFGLVYLLSRNADGGLPSARLVLTGVALAAAVNAVTIMVLLRMRQDEYGFIASWLAGNIWGSTWENVAIVAPWLAVLLLVVLFKSRTLDVLGLGSQTATGLGVALNRENLILLAAAVGLASACVAVGGGISFVGLICPHLVRRLVGLRHRVLIPATMLTGGALMLLSDLIGRTAIMPDEIPIGVVATIIGTPYFLYLLVNKRRFR
jgi:iron complex transport system permease protein